MICPSLVMCVLPVPVSCVSVTPGALGPVVVVLVPLVPVLVPVPVVVLGLVLEAVVVVAVELTVLVVVAGAAVVVVWWVSRVNAKLVVAEESPAALVS